MGKRGLTDKQRRFVEEYLVDLNATQAAVRAGYSPRTASRTGHENLKKPEIAQEVARLQAERSERTEITADRVVQELARLAFSDLRDVAKWSGTEITLQGSAELSGDAAAAVSEVKYTSFGLGIKLHSKPQALKLLGDHLGMFVQKVEHSGPDGGPIEVDDARHRLQELVAGRREAEQEGDDAED